MRALTAAISPIPEQSVVSVGVGEKVTQGRPTGILALKFLVRVKFSASQMSADHLLPKTVNGLPVDVEEVGLFRRFARRTTAKKNKSRAAVATEMPNPRVKIRPAQPGCSMGFRDPDDLFVMAGTFGALVEDDAASYVLSNNHVLADDGLLPIDSPIFQPGLLDGGNPNTDQIAELTRFEPLQAETFNQVDCAIAQALKPSLVSRDILFIGPP